MSKLNLKEILLSLMSIRSYSGEEKELSNYVYKFLQERGFSPIKIGENIICSLNNSIDNFNQKKIALVGHLDTIILAEEPVIRQDENIILGLGSVDMKAGLSCMLKLTEELDKIKHNIILVFYTGEESPLPNGLTELIDKRIFEALDLAIILEPTNSEIEVGCFGRILAEYCFYGKQAHSAYSDEGTNAIYRARGFIEKLSQIQLPEKDNNSFKESINITKIETDSRYMQNICRLSFFSKFR